MNIRVVAIIPARYNSTRLPGKPLALIGDKSMIQRVYERVLASGLFDDCIIATDDERIYSHCAESKMKVMLTSTMHENGTSRCLEVAEKLGLKTDDIVVNVQGDEPFISSKQLRLIVSCFENKDTEIASLCKRLQSDVSNANIVKVVKTMFGKALYFSRSVIPLERELGNNNPEYFKHVGLYAYRLGTLQKIVLLPESMLETAEKLEQLRWMENGYSIQLKETDEENLAVDTPEDLARAIEYAKSFDNLK